MTATFTSSFFSICHSIFVLCSHSGSQPTAEQINDLIGGDDLNTSDEDDEESIRSSQPSLEEPNYDTHNNSAGDQRDHRRAHNASTDNQANRRNKSQEHNPNKKKLNFNELFGFESHENDKVEDSKQKEDRQLEFESIKLEFSDTKENDKAIDCSKPVPKWNNHKSFIKKSELIEEQLNDKPLRDIKSYTKSSKKAIGAEISQEDE